MKYAHKTKFIRAVDGDTVVLLIDHGLSVYSQQILRLARVNCPELKSADPEIKKKAMDAKAAVTYLLSTVEFLTCETIGKDPYGRWVSEVWVGAINVSDWLIEEEFAVKYKTGTQTTVVSDTSDDCGVDPGGVK